MRPSVLLPRLGRAHQVIALVCDHEEPPVGEPRDEIRAEAMPDTGREEGARVACNVAGPDFDLVETVESPGTLKLLPVRLPWAFLTSALEWLFLVPLVPFWQPIFTLDQPYWIGFFVHFTSASMYPLFPFLPDWMGGERPPARRKFAAIWSGLAAAGLVALGVLAFLGSQNRELPHIGDSAFDGQYMQRMSAHHAQGVELAEMAGFGASDPHLRSLARLMAAAQRGEIGVFDRWWQSWFAGPLPAATQQDHRKMPGMLSRNQLEELQNAGPDTFDRRFVELMTVHHRGAIAMADDAIDRASDVRLKLMSHSIRHQQSGQIELMHGNEGVSAVRAAVAALLGFKPVRGEPGGG